MKTNLILLSLTLFLEYCSCFNVLDLKDVKYTLQPEVCNPDSDFVIVVHSAPDHFELRNAVRETWASGAKTVFVLGENVEFNNDILNEHKKHGDILQATFQDAYRNMTYKHLIAYRWIRDSCNNIKFVLKTDDDQAVDVNHLKIYVKNYIDTTELFYLCHFLKGEKPRRDPENKWFVSREEYPENSYPDYCAGWAYVSNIATISNILKVAENNMPYFWIDDLYVTGILASKITQPIRNYNWAYNFLSEHEQHTQDLLHGKMFTPELMVASDISAVEIRNLSAKFRQCADKNCYKVLYENQDLMNELKPPSELRRESNVEKSEL